MKTSYLKAHPLENRYPSGRPIFTPTVVRIRTHALWDPKAPKSACGSTVEIGKEGYLLQSNTLGSA